MRLWLLVACLVQELWCSRAYHVLVIFPAPSRSHNTLGKGVVEALLQAGHEVSWATPYPPEEKVKGLNIIDVSNTRAIVESLDIHMNDVRKMTGGLSFVRQYARNISKTAIQAPALREAVTKGKYDAVVTEYFFSETDAGFAAVLRVPWIQVNGVLMSPILEAQVDEVRSISTIPLMFKVADIPMKFLDRLFNSFMYLVLTVDCWFDKPALLALYEEMFAPLAAARGTALPPYEESHYNVSVLLVNSHASYAPAFPRPPNVIEIGGYHLKEKIPPLPKDLQDLLDGSPQGVVYFSMGSVLKSATFAEQTKRELLRVFGELPYTVLWKFEEQLDGRPENVHIRPWMPQDSILAHPNIKLFITHGGLLSSLEALHSGVPLLAIPMFGDQPGNADRATLAGYAKRVEFGPQLAQDLKESLDEMLTNDSYYKRAKHLSKLFRNREVPPKKLISHYVELAIETKGAYHLRSISLQHAWYQRWMLDQLALLAAALALLLLAARWALRACCRKICGTNNIQFNKVKKN